MTKHDITLKVDEYLNKNTVAGYIDSNSGKVVVHTNKDDLVYFVYNLLNESKEFQLDIKD